MPLRFEKFPIHFYSRRHSSKMKKISERLTQHTNIIYYSRYRYNMDPKKSSPIGYQNQGPHMRQSRLTYGSRHRSVSPGHSYRDSKGPRSRSLPRLVNVTSSINFSLSWNSFLFSFFLLQPNTSSTDSTGFQKCKLWFNSIQFKSSLFMCLSHSVHLSLDWSLSLRSVVGRRYLKEFAFLSHSYTSWNEALGSAFP